MAAKGPNFPLTCWKKVNYCIYFIHQRGLNESVPQKGPALFLHIYIRRCFDARLLPLISKNLSHKIFTILPQNLHFETLNICYENVIIKASKFLGYRFPKRANPFHGVCSFRFDDICKKVRVD